MNALQHGEIIRTLLQQQLGYPWFLGFADEASGQYGVLECKAWDTAAEPSLSGVDRDIDTPFRVKAVTGTVSGVGKMLGRVRDVLWTDQRAVRVPMDGWLVDVRYLRSEFIDVDESITLAATKRHPAFGVDTYQLTAQPL